MTLTSVSRLRRGNRSSNGYIDRVRTIRDTRSTSALLHHFASFAPDRLTPRIYENRKPPPQKKAKIVKKWRKKKRLSPFELRDYVSAHCFLDRLYFTRARGTLFTSVSALLLFAPPTRSNSPLSSDNHAISLSRSVLYFSHLVRHFRAECPVPLMGRSISACFPPCPFILIPVCIFRSQVRESAGIRSRGGFVRVPGGRVARLKPCGRSSLTGRQGLFRGEASASVYYHNKRFRGWR